MNTICRYILVATATLALTTPQTLNASSDDQMTRAVFAAYDKLLREDPKDYETWYHRALEYYRHNEYMRAMNDVDQALKLIPEKEKDLRQQAYMLRANIYEQTGRHSQALDDLNSVLAIAPGSYVATYQRANVLYELGEYSRAKADYQRLQRTNPRSVEAFIGLARVAVKENNLGIANECLDNAVATEPNNADLYVRRASVRRLMHNDRGAVDDLILALSTDSRNTRATNDLITLSNDNYPVVIEGLTSAMAQAPNVAMFVYLRAFIAQAHYRYTAALADYRQIIDRNLYNYSGIYASMAECGYALGDYTAALTDADKAIAMDRNNAAHLVVRAKIHRALGNYDQAKADCASALAIKKDDKDALNQMALTYISLKNYREAANLFGELALSDTQTPMLYINRAWLLATYLNEPVAAAGFYNHIIDNTTADDGDIHSLRGFALLFNGRKTDAIQWIEHILATHTDNDGYLNYMAACLYAQADETDKALTCVERALANGYADTHNWTANTDSRINVAPLRSLPRFQSLLTRP